MCGSHYKLDNLCGIVDKNDLQIDGPVCEVMTIDPLAEKYTAFNWNVLEINGHDLAEIIRAFEQARNTNSRPTVIIAHTVKGKGVTFMENQAGWHGIAPNREQFEKAMMDLATPSVPPKRVDTMLAGAARHAQEQESATVRALPKFRRDYWWNAGDTMKVDMDPTRMGFGRGLETAGVDERVVTIHADISGSIKITDFEAKHPERKNRVFSVGIAEQNMMSVAAGLAKEGLIPVTGTYGVFASGRCWDQIRTTICYSNVNVKIAGAHGGISVGADGATHQALEEISLINILPNMHLLVPCDSVETERATLAGLLDIVGPTYIRYAREATPVVTTKSTPFKYGVANIIRYRDEKPRFVDAFETILASNYKGEGEDVSIVACGPMVPEAMRAAWLLKEEHGLETRIVNIHTVKPLDAAALAAAAEDTGLVVTAEEHQVGGFGGIVAAAILQQRRDGEGPLLFDMVGVADRFGLSGKPWDLMREFGLCAEHIAERILRLQARREKQRKIAPAA